ncbi:uncharacterized protein LOC128712595 [Anopheles marshallii]|uniref:uncharacterized protein LOC128712595 n=1 Tax=Anopheles marshallii TaxID=1521116 RepID=UPI00237C0E38|nr:uncharacterized protein LOC128712595 [Anopheles marshallii]
MRNNSCSCKFLNEIFSRQRRIRRNSRSSRSALRTITKGLPVSVPKQASQHLPRRKKQFQKAVDIFIHSSCKFDRVNEPQRSRASANRSHRHADRMVSRFLTLPRADQSHYLNCADMMETPKQVTVCSDPFLLFLQDFTKECSKIKALETDQLYVARRNPTANHTQDEPDDTVAIEDPVLDELPTNEQILSVAKAAWNELSDEAREPYRFRAIMAALFPLSMDQAF